MKKLLISFCAASLLAASAISYGSTITFVNEYRQPVNFVASSGYAYNPVAQGTILSGGHFTFQVDGPITPDYNFMAYAPLRIECRDGLRLHWPDCGRCDCQSRMVERNG